MGDKTVGLTSFIEVIETIADNKYVLGDLLVEIGVSGPDLEATLSTIAMAQGELGHARLLYNWAFDLRGSKKQEIEKQTGKAFAAVVSVDSWIDLIGSLYVVNEGLELVLKAMLDGRHPDVINRINKLLKEQKEHIMYSRGWVEQLLNDQGSIPRKMNESLKKIIKDVETWLHHVEHSEGLVEGGYVKADVNLTASFHSKLASLPLQRAESDVV